MVIEFLRASTRITGFSLIDELIAPLSENWILEFYGDELLVLYLYHMTLAYNSAWRKVYSVIARERGGLDPVLLSRLCRVYDCSLSNVMVSRVFRTEELIGVLESLKRLEGYLAAILYPYSYLPRDPSSYWRATLVTGLIQSISSRNQVVLFNNTSKFGEYMPEGGSMHHHVVKVIVRMWRKRDLCYAKLVKHAGKKSGFLRMFRLKLLEDATPVGSRTLLDWAKTPA